MVKANYEYRMGDKVSTLSDSQCGGQTAETNRGLLLMPSRF